MTNTELQMLTTEWALKRGIIPNGNAQTQYIKLIEEVGELGAALVRHNDAGIKDAIGDALVVLTSLSVLCGTDLNECWNLAYNEIKDRTGKLLDNGNFVKDNDTK